MEIEHRTLMAYKVTMVGVVGRDPEVKYLPNGQAVANFSVTHHFNSRGYATPGGVPKVLRQSTRTVSNEVTVIGWLAEVCGKYLAKGRKVHIVGPLQTSRNDNGERQRVIVAEGIYFVGAPRQTELGQEVAGGDKVVTRWLSEYGLGARR
jgi:single-strand DNA-binding protein